MSLSINNNFLSLGAQRKLGEHTTEASTLIARLSAGTRIDQAIDFVGQQRVAAGASSNRLDMAAANARTGSVNLEGARDRIQDVDYASSTAKLTRAQILQQAASAMMTRANGEPRAVLALLR